MQICPPVYSTIFRKGELIIETHVMEYRALLFRASAITFYIIVLCTSLVSNLVHPLIVVNASEGTIRISNNFFELDNIFS